jgi:hypothetical protein
MLVSLANAMVLYTSVQSRLNPDVYCLILVLSYSNALNSTYTIPPRNYDLTYLAIKWTSEIDLWTNSKLFRPKLSLNRTKNGLSGKYVFGHFKVLSYTYNTTTMNLADFDLIINLLLILICFAVFDSQKTCSPIRLSK